MIDDDISRWCRAPGAASRPGRLWGRQQPCGVWGRVPGLGLQPRAPPGGPSQRGCAPACPCSLPAARTPAEHPSIQHLYLALSMGNIETVLPSSIAAGFWAAFVVAGTMWYGSTTPLELFGPSHAACCRVWDGSPGMGQLWVHHPGSQVPCSRAEGPSPGPHRDEYIECPCGGGRMGNMMSRPAVSWERAAAFKLPSSISCQEADAAVPCSPAGLLGLLRRSWSQQPCQLRLQGQSGCCNMQPQATLLPHPGPGHKPQPCVAAQGG